MNRRLLCVLRYAWPAPYTLLGILIGLILGGRFQRVSGVIEIHGPAVAYVLARLPVNALALTLGHVVFGRNLRAIAYTRDHERVHVRQYERWGVAFVPAYVLESAWLYARGRDGYRDNHFEVEAFRTDELK